MKANMIRALVVTFSIIMLGSLAIVPTASYSQSSDSGAGAGGGMGGCCGGGGEQAGTQKQTSCGPGTHEEAGKCVPNPRQAQPLNKPASK